MSEAVAQVRLVSIKNVLFFVIFVFHILSISIQELWWICQLGVCKN